MNLSERIKRRRIKIFERANLVRCDDIHQVDQNDWSIPPEWFEPDNFIRAQKLFHTYKST